MPGAVPSHNHLSCMLIPAMIKAHDFQERWPAPLSEVSWLNLINMDLYVPACNIPLSAGIIGGVHTLKDHVFCLFAL